MIKGKIASIAFGGFAGFMLISRAFNLVENSINRICEANKWKNYYKYGGNGNVVAPGYSMHTHKIDDENEVVVEDENQTKKQAAAEDTGKKVADAINNAVDAIFNKDKKKEDIPEEKDNIVELPVTINEPVIEKTEEIIDSLDIEIPDISEISDDDLEE